MLQLTGYGSRLSAAPGDAVQFFVNSEQRRPYRADIVRLIHGDLHPDGPGFKEQEIGTPVSGEYPARHQVILAGSFVIVPDAPPLHVESLTQGILPPSVLRPNSVLRARAVAFGPRRRGVRQPPELLIYWWSKRTR